MTPQELKRINNARRALGLTLFPPMPVVAAGDDNYREWEHPRDKNGKWIEKGGIVRIGSKIAGTVESMNPDSTISVRITDSTDPASPAGSVVNVPNDDIEVVKAKATLPDAAPAAPAAPAADAPRAPRTYRPMTDEERSKHNVMPGWSDVVYNERYDNNDPNVPDDQYDGLIATGRDALGNKQYLYDERHRAIAKEGKFGPSGSVTKTLENLDKISTVIRRDMNSDDAASALALQLLLGMRVGGQTSKVKKNDKQAFGASSLQARHVTLNDDGSVSLSFDAKKGVHINLRSSDPTIREMMESRLSTRSGEDQLFDTNDTKVRKYFEKVQGEIGVSGLTPHNLRHAFATTMARQFMGSYPAPANKKQYTDQRKQIGEMVSRLLGNDANEALKTYIDPKVFDAWNFD